MEKENKKFEGTGEMGNVTFEELREKLIEHSRNGSRSRIRLLIIDSGESKLSDIPKRKYLEIMREVERW